MKNMLTWFLRAICINLIWINFYVFSVEDSSITQGESLESIQQLAEDYVIATLVQPEQGEFVVKANTLDSRLQFPKCDDPLMASTPGKQVLNSTGTVLIQCISNQWQVYVPVRIQLLIPLVITARPLARGVKIDATDIRVEMVDSRLQRGSVYQETAQLVGAKVKRGIGINQPISSSDICVVCRDETVTLIAGAKGMSIIIKAVALNDAVYGEEVRVKNIKSNRVVTGVVSGIGEVNIPF